MAGLSKRLLSVVCGSPRCPAAEKERESAHRGTKPARTEKEMEKEGKVEMLLSDIKLKHAGPAHAREEPPVLVGLKSICSSESSSFSFISTRIFRVSLERPSSLP